MTVYVKRSFLPALVFLLGFSAAVVAQTVCSSPIGCLECELRVKPGGVVIGPLCVYGNQNGGCECTISIAGSEVTCSASGSCTYSGWGGGDPPAE